MASEIVSMYENKVRLRVCGLCWSDDDLLMVNHSSLTSSDFWAPPGGGVEFGETAEEALKREFLEETNLTIIPGPFLFACEFIKDPLHAVELFFVINQFSGELKTGSDPELQIIRQVSFQSPGKLWGKPSDHLHGIFKIARNPDELRKLSGFYTI